MIDVSPINITSICNVFCNAHNGLNICHINAGSFSSKYTVLYQMLSSSNIDVIMVSESWLNESISSILVHFLGFNLFRNDRGSRGGGVCISVRENFSAKVIYVSCC